MLAYVVVLVVSVGDDNIGAEDVTRKPSSEPKLWNFRLPERACCTL
jgi:hypothetical protein